MKTQFKFLFSAAVFVLAGTLACVPSRTAMAQSSTEEVPGDNFSLEGALELFKKSASPQEFEQLLNSPDSKVNNLDLNGDGEIDYIRVIDKNEGNIHAFILQAVVSQTENQDVAVIELEKKRNGEAVLQIVGDADVYGIETIIEPTEEVRVNAGASTARTVVNVWAWPSVQYIYGPSYAVWISPWSYAYYPGWYRPWRPVAYYVYDPFWAPYRPYYSVCFRHRVVYAPRIYRPYRTTSVIVHNRSYTQINNYRNSSPRYRHDNGDYARGARYNRYDSEHGRSRESYSHNNSRSNSDNSNYSNNRYNNSRSHNNDRVRSTENRGPVDRTSRTSQNNSRPQRQMQQAPQHQRQSAPQMNRTPQQQHQRSTPNSSSPHRGGGGNGSGNGSGGGRRH